MIHEDFLPKYYLKEIQDYFLSDHCEWYYQDKISGVESNSPVGSFGFSSTLFNDGAYVPNFPGTLCRSLVAHVQEAVETFTGSYQNVIRARADMTMYNPDKHQHEYHTDFDFPHVTAIFYVNTSDGNTVLSNGMKVEPVENRLLVFNGLTPHTGHSPSKHNNRVLINMNFVQTP